MAPPHELVESAEARVEGPEVTEELKKQALEKEHAAKGLSGLALENQIRKNRVRWLKNYLTEEGTRRAKELGWPNTYTFTKSLAESLIAKHGAGLPIAIVRPSIVETSIAKPFRRMLFLQRLLLQFLGDLRAFHPRFRRLNQFMQAMPLFFRVEVL